MTITENRYVMPDGRIVIIRSEVDTEIKVVRVEPKEEPESYPDRDAAGDEEC